MVTQNSFLLCCPKQYPSSAEQKTEHKGKDEQKHICVSLFITVQEDKRLELIYISVEQNTVSITVTVMYREAVSL